MSDSNITSSKQNLVKLSEQTFLRVFSLVDKLKKDRGVAVFANTVITEAIDLYEKKVGK